MLLPSARQSKPKSKYNSLRCAGTVVPTLAHRTRKDGAAGVSGVGLPKSCESESRTGQNIINPQSMCDRPIAATRLLRGDRLRIQAFIESIEFETRRQSIWRLRHADPE
jgi:hypothetical protein